MINELIRKYEEALDRSTHDEKLMCHTVNIAVTLDMLRGGGIPTTLEVVWVDYFLNSIKARKGGK